MSLGDEPGYPDTGHTRTRLPESDPYGGASRRGGRSSSRSLVTVVGVVVLLIAAIAFANRGGGDNSPNGTNTGTGTNGTANQPATSSTAASGTKPVETKSGEGIPTGFAQSEQGAQSAAANYAVTLGSTGMFNKDSRHRIVSSLYTSAAADRLQSTMDAAYTTRFLNTMGLDANGNAPQGSTFVSRAVPVGTKVEQYDSTNAKVSVWYMGLIGMSGTSSTNPVTTTWKTWTFELQWADNAWKVSADTQTNGPAPVPGDDQAATSDAISKAVEQYGGFTYAR
ncbi:hypothetical protein ABT075_34450 [Streptomyces sp. NPDC002677]|uniref:hypothetical protein n=1 Tax=Streptomyces sp. NPDC002677 TaxID=3154774 RepID=UPI0033322740